jgi:CheY-like chemotaxis protein
MMTAEKPIVILHAEDNPAHAEMVCRALKRTQITVRMEHVEDGRQALDYLYQRGRYEGSNGAARPDLILLDLRMPEIDGLEVLKRIKGDPAFMHVPVIVLTTSAAPNDLATAYAHHVNSYLVKPVNYSEFCLMMEAIVDYWGRWNQPACCPKELNPQHR